MTLSLDSCGLSARTFTAIANALRPNNPLTTLRIGELPPRGAFFRCRVTRVSEPASARED